MISEVMLSTAEMVEEIERIVEKACISETNIFGYGGWSHHIIKVAKYGLFLANAFEANPEIVVIAALLHDYSGIKDPNLYSNHHENSAFEAEKILMSFGYPEDKIISVKHCIISHRASVVKERLTPEANCLANADALAHIMQVPSLLKLAYVHYNMGIDEGADWVKSKITRSWNKLDPMVQQIAKPFFEAALHTLNTNTSEDDPFDHGMTFYDQIYLPNQRIDPNPFTAPLSNSWFPESG